MFRSKSLWIFISHSEFILYKILNIQINVLSSNLGNLGLLCLRIFLQSCLRLLHHWSHQISWLEMERIYLWWLKYSCQTRPPGTFNCQFDFCFVNIELASQMYSDQNRTLVSIPDLLWDSSPPTLSTTLFPCCLNWSVSSLSPDCLSGSSPRTASK